MGKQVVCLLLREYNGIRLLLHRQYPSECLLYWRMSGEFFSFEVTVSFAIPFFIEVTKNVIIKVILTI